MMYGLGYGVIILCSILWINKILTKGKFDPGLTMVAASGVGFLSWIKENKDLN